MQLICPAWLQEETASLSNAADGGAQRKGRPGMAGELLGDCQLHGATDGAGQWKASDGKHVHISSGSAQGRPASLEVAGLTASNFAL